MSFVNTLQTQSKEDAQKALFNILNNKAMDVLSSVQEDTESIDEGVRKIADYSNGRHKATTHKDSDTSEYQVKFHTDGKHLKNADYFTDDKSDASDTAKSQIDKLHAKD